MLKGELERLDDPTAVAGRTDLAYQAPQSGREEEALPPVGIGSGAAPLGNPLPEGDLLPQPPAAGPPPEELAWRNAIENLLQMLAPEGPAGTGLPFAAPAAFVSPQPGAETVPEPTAGEAPELYLIEPLESATPPLLSLEESDLFGDGAGEIDLMLTSPGQAVRGFQGMDSDLFGSGPEVAPISISKHNDNARTIQPTKEPDPPPETFGEGYISLVGKSQVLNLDVKQAREWVDENGEIYVDGDGDDVLRLSGGWVLVGERPEKGAQYYADASGEILLTVHNTETLLV